MKVYEKKVRNIVIDDIEFKYLVVEKPYEIIVRIYSAVYKSTFLEVYFHWKDSYYINLYRPKIVELLIRYGINKGWNYEEQNTVLKIKDSTNLIKVLDLKNYNYL
jgi:hypothetical protein